MTKTLQPEDIIAQYRVVGPLGAGGMGEVYLAQDQSLDRNVALKVLPPDLVKSEDRLRRFVQEAKSASSLNHPNIITIYEIGAEKVKSSSGSETGPLQFISMELVSGKTLGAKIHEEKTDLRTLLGFLAQAAEGIAKAHAAGIVHRDLKPGNIMVSDDGFTKVLDFGLAKLTEKRLESASATAMTEIADLTSEGAVLGTVHYMSPEQVQAKSVDHRSDIFSFGCLLYEAATRRRPFVADSNVETMHKILHDKPAPIEELNPQAPAELRRLIRRCLAKTPDQRLQSMKDLAIELREIVDEYDTLSASATSSTTTGSHTRAIPARKSRSLTPILIGAVVIAAAGIGYGIFGSRGRSSDTVPLQNMRAVTQTSRGDVNFSTLSPDGRYLAYVAGTAGRSTLRVRQVATGSDVEILPVQNTGLESPSFSPDGNYLFFLKRLPEQPNYRTLMRVPSLGGAEEQKGFDVDSRVTFSPDGKRYCFVRGIPQEDRAALVVRELDGDSEREVANVYRPEVPTGAPAWSPDGKRIAIFSLQQSPGLHAKLLMFDAESGKREQVFDRTSAVFRDVSWVPDGKALVAAGTVISEGVQDQVFVISYPRGEMRRVTNDFDEYNSVSVGGADGSIGALRTSQITNLFISDLLGATPKRLTSSTSREHSPFSLEMTADRLVFNAAHDNHLGIATIPFAGGEKRWLPTGAGHAFGAIARRDRVVFMRFENEAQHIWAMGVDGAGLKQITDGGSENILDVSPDGTTVAFGRLDSTSGVWLTNVDGNSPRLIAPDALMQTAIFTSDSRHVIVVELHPDASGLVQTVLRVMPVDGGDEVGRFTPPPQAIDPSPGAGTEWTYLNRNDAAQNVFAGSIAGAAERKVTNFTDGRVTDHMWSPDFTRIAVVRRDDAGENLWVVNADGSSPKQITSFDNQDIFEIEWTFDSKLLAMRAGTLSRDVVLIKNFQ